MSRGAAGNLNPEELARLAERLGARVEFRNNRWAVYPPNLGHRPIFMAVKWNDSRTPTNTVVALRRAGLDVLAEPEETPAMAATADAKGVLPAINGKPVAKPGPPSTTARLEQQQRDLLELVTDQLDQLAARLADIETRLAATPGVPPARDPNSDLDDAIVAFMASAPIKLSGEVIAANLDGVTAQQVWSRLGALAKAGRVDQDGDLYRLQAIRNGVTRGA